MSVPDSCVDMSASILTLVFVITKEVPSSADSRKIYDNLVRGGYFKDGSFNKGEKFSGSPHPLDTPISVETVYSPSGSDELDVVVSTWGITIFSNNF